MTIQKGNFIEISYTGYLKEDNSIFDTTDPEIGKKEDIPNVKPIIIVVGEGQVIKGFDDALIGKEFGKEYQIELNADEAFGKKETNLLKIIPLNLFIKQKINPFPGLQVNIDGMIGTIKTAGGGRTIVDFNHPLAGKDIKYQFKAIKLIEGMKEKAEAYFNIIGLKDFNVKIEGKNILIESKKEIPKELKGHFETKFKELLNAEKIEFKAI
mgnify:CR=1 FL=1